VVAGSAAAAIAAQVRRVVALAVAQAAPVAATVPVAGDAPVAPAAVHAAPAAVKTRAGVAGMLTPCLLMF
jgi:hypothetical protein